MLEPESTTPGSIMPKYPWLYSDDLDTSLTSAKLRALRTLGAPYTDEEVDKAAQYLAKQADQVTNELYEQGVAKSDELQKKEIIALIAYMQRLGTDIRPKSSN